MNLKTKIEEKVVAAKPPKLGVKAIPLYVELTAFHPYRYYSETLTVPEARALLRELSSAIDEAVRLGRETLSAAERECCHEHS